MEMSDEVSREFKDKVFDLESVKVWTMVRSYQLLLPSMKYKAKLEFLKIWFNDNVPEVSKTPNWKIAEAAKLMRYMQPKPTRDSVQISDGAEEQLPSRIVTAKSKTPSMKIAERRKWLGSIRKATRDSVQMSDLGEEQLPSPTIIGGVGTGKEVEAEVSSGSSTGDEAEWECDTLDDYYLEGLRFGIAQIAAGSSVQMDASDVEEDFEEKDEASDMDISWPDLISFIQDQMIKLTQPSYFSTEGKAIVSVWSDCDKILRSIKKLLSASAQIDQLFRLVPELNEAMRLSSDSNYSESSEYNSAAEKEEKDFAAYRHMWEVFNGNKFEEMTSLSSMIFTHCAPGLMPWYAVVKPTVQILSIKITDLTGLKWPLRVYGIVAARDALDKRRNQIFLCPRNGGQLVTKQDPFLRLTGPSRAVVCEGIVPLEIQLKLKGRMESEDKVLMSTKLSYNGDSADRFSTLNIGNHFCKMEFCCQKLERSVQATVVSVRVVSQGISLQHGAQIFCSSIPRGFKGHDDNPLPCPDLLLHDWQDGMTSIDGHLDLSRHVVSAELGGKLRIVVKDCSLAGITGDVLFTPKKCNFSQATCLVGDTSVLITVAWSLLVQDDECILSSSYVDPFEACPPLHPSVLTFLKKGVAKE